MMESYKKKFSALKFNCSIIILGLFVFLIVLILAMNCLPFDFHFDLFASGQDRWLEESYYISLIILTLFLVSVAWSQLMSISNTTRSDFLLRIDERYGSTEIVKARIIIHRFYCQTNSNNIDVKTHAIKIANKVNEICDKAEEAENFSYLLNFLDFLETIAYFCNKGDISEDEVSCYAE